MVRPSEVNRIVDELNTRYPTLGLRTRVDEESPSKRLKNNAELCYDRLHMCYYRQPSRFQLCLNEFHQQASQRAKVDGSNSLVLLINCLPQPTEPAEPRQQVKPAISSFTDKLNMPTRATTPELDGDEVQMVDDLGSPTGSRQSASYPPQAKKRRSTSGDQKDSAKMLKVKSPSRTTKLRAQPKPISYSELADTYVVDLTGEAPLSASTVAAMDGAADEPLSTSFNTSITIPDAKPSCSNPNFPSTFSLLSSIARKLDDSNPPGRHSIRCASPSRKPQQKDRARQLSENQFSSPMAKHAASSSADRSKALDTLEQQSPSRALSQLHIGNKLPITTYPSVLNDTKECPQMRDLASHGLFCSDIPVSDLPFRIVWECQRWSLATGISTRYLFDRIAKQRPNTDDLDEFSRFLRQALPDSCQAKAPVEGSRNAWLDTSDDKVQYKARLKFSKSPTQPFLFETCMQPLFTEQKTCRFQRKFGSHRVLYVDIPNLANVPDTFGEGSALENYFLEWLCVPKDFLGRQWQAIHLKQSKAKKEDIERYQGYRVVLLAVNGHGLEPVSIESALQWHMDLDNAESKQEYFRKRFSRLDLGFSRTYPTFVFKRSEVQYVDDIHADNTPEPDAFRDSTLDWEPYLKSSGSDGRNLTDGCSIMSVAAMKLVWEEKLGRTDPLPAAIQGRIGGAKGVWVRSGPADSTTAEDTAVWIKIRKSQLKFAPHESDTDEKCDPHRWTFEVSHWTDSHTHDSSVSGLHMDMIPLLVDRGVPVESLEAVVSEALLAQHENITDVLNDRTKTRYWLRDQEGSMEDSMEEKDIDTGSALPISHVGKAKYLLEHGFEPRKSGYLTDLIKKITQRRLSKAVQKLHVKMHSSVNLIGIADPIGVLEPNTVHIGFSQSFRDRDSGEHIHHLRDREALVTRFPLQMPWDIQRIRVVYEPRLEHLKDCVVFPTRGPISLPSKLQGGDLDGDRFDLIWDRRLVAPFLNAPVPTFSMPPEYFGVVKDTRTVGDVLTGKATYQNFLREGFKARLKRVPLGPTSKFLKRQAYRLGPGAYHHSSIIRHSELYTLMMDADKQGYDYTDHAYKRYLREEKSLLPWSKEPGDPAYQLAIAKGVQAGMKGTVCPSEHPNDIIFFMHILPQMIKVLNAIAKFIELHKDTSDDVLMKMWLDANSRKEDAMGKEMQALTKKLAQLREDWASDFAKDSSKTYNPAITQKFREAYKKIQPRCSTLPGLSIFRRFSQEPSNWDLLKASTLYSQCWFLSKQAVLYQLAGEDLAYLKVHSMSHQRVASDIYCNLKMKRKNGLEVNPLSEKGLENQGELAFEEIDFTESNAERGRDEKTSGKLCEDGPLAYC